MRVSFNSYRYSPILANNNPESNYKIQTQRNNYNLAFGRKPMTLKEFVTLSSISAGGATVLATIIYSILQK